MCIRDRDIYVYDMFNLYKYENMLYTMKLSGKEVHDALEMSYELWTNRMTCLLYTSCFSPAKRC